MFKSSDFIFRPTAIALAMVDAGLVQASSLVREPRLAGMLRQKNDNYNQRPSKATVIPVHTAAGGAFGKQSKQATA